MTDRRQEGEAFRPSEETLRALFYATAQGVILQDARGRIVSINPAAESILGLSAAQTIGQTPKDLQLRVVLEDGSEVADDTYPATVALRTSQEVRNVRIGIFNASRKEYRWLDINAVPLFRPGEDKPYQVLTTLEDVTEIIGLQQNLSHSLDEVRRERDRLQALENVAEAGLSSLDLQELLDLIVKRIAEGMNAHSGHIMLLDEEREELIAQAVHNVPGQFETRINVDEGFVGLVHKSRGTVYVADASKDPRVTDPYLDVPEIKSILGTPIAKRDEFLGVLYINMREVREFSEEDRKLLEWMAATVANAVENAKILASRQQTEEFLDTERHLSLLMQRALLPQTPTISEDYGVAFQYLPVFERREIGGDFYDVFETAGGKAGIVIGDVSGKGLESASMAAATRSTVYAFAHETHSAGEALTRANAVLSYGSPAFDQFVTLFLAIIDLETGEMRYASAGHPPSMVHRSDGSVELLETGKNIPLGFMEGVNYSESRDHLNPGDKLILYTDGISEARRGQEMLDIEGIQRILEEQGSLPPQDLATEILAAASQWAEGKLTDDAAIVVLERWNDRATSPQKD